MIKHLWTVACNKSSIDSVSNNLNIFDVFDKITITSNGEKPEGTVAVPFPFEVISQFHKTKIEKVDTPFQRKLEIKGPGGSTLAESVTDLSFPKNKPNYRHILRSGLFPVSGEGTYRLVTSIKRDLDGTFEVISDLPVELVINSLET